jgi:hypothetical protein
MSMKQKPFAVPDEIRLAREIEASKFLLEQLRGEGGETVLEDSQLLADTLEGETSLFELVEAVVSSIYLEDEVALAGLKKASEFISNRKLAAENRIERKRTLIFTALQLAELDQMKTALKTVSIKKVAPKLQVIEESLIPTMWWQPSDPTLDKKKLSDYLKARAEALELAAQIEDAAERKAAIEKIELEFLEVPGAELSNGSLTVSFR